MTWTRLPDDFTDRPTVLALSRSARLLHVEALVWCNRLLTDGEVPARLLPRISDSDDLAQDVADLAEAGLWVRGDNDTWLVDWSDQETKERVEKRRKDRNETQQRYNDRKARHSKGDHSTCDPRFCPALRDAPPGAPGDAPGGASDDSHPTSPALPRPEGEGQGQGQGGGSAPAGPFAALQDAATATPRETDEVQSQPGHGPPPGITVRVGDLQVGPNGVLNPLGVGHGAK